MKSKILVTRKLSDGAEEKLKKNFYITLNLTDIFREFTPFIGIQLIMLACVMFFSEIMTQNFHEFVPKK